LASSEDFEFDFIPRAKFDDPNPDISHIVTNINGLRAETRKRLANGPETRAFLQAAVDLTAELFEANPADKLPDDNDGLRPTMSYLSRDKVLKRAREAFPDLPLSKHMLRYRWRSQSDFVADFISYALAEQHWSLGVALSEHSSALLMSGVNFPQAVHRVAYEDLKRVLELPTYRFQLLAVASAQADSASAEALMRMYKNLSQVWTRLYKKVFEHYGLSLRPGITLDDFNIILQSTAEGLGMRLMSGVDEPIIDHARKTSLLGTAALTMFLALIDPGDGLTVEQATERAMEILQARGPQTS
jgi:hypothetical protein